MRVTLFVTCVVDLFEPDVGVADGAGAAGRRLRGGRARAARRAAGSRPGTPGTRARRRKVARTTLAALEADDGDVVVVPAGSCATMIRVFWPELFEVVGDHDAAARARALGARTRELTELARRRSTCRRSRWPSPTAVAYHHSCHMLRELRDRGRSPQQLLDAVDGCERVAWSADHRCCGFGGLFSLQAPRDQRGHGRRQAHVAGRGRRPTSSSVPTRPACCTCGPGPSTRAAPSPTRHIAQLLAEALPLADDRLHPRRDDAARAHRDGHAATCGCAAPWPAPSSLRRRPDRRAGHPRGPRRPARAPPAASATTSSAACRTCSSASPTTCWPPVATCTGPPTRPSANDYITRLAVDRRRRQRGEGQVDGHRGDRASTRRSSAAGVGGRGDRPRRVDHPARPPHAEPHHRPGRPPRPLPGPRHPPGGGRRRAARSTPSPSTSPPSPASSCEPASSPPTSGVTGCNFAVAETGSIVLVENEGNGRFSHHGAPHPRRRDGHGAHRRDVGPARPA